MQRSFHPYAGVGPRAVAIIIDFLVSAGLVLIVDGMIIVAVLQRAGESPATLNLGPLYWWLGISFVPLVLLVCLVYAAVLEGLTGQTVGKRLLGLTVVRTSGQEAGWKASLIRNGMRVIDGIGMYLVAAVAVWLTERRQRIGDLLADTVVIQREEFLEGAGSPATPTEREGAG